MALSLSGYLYTLNARYPHLAHLWADRAFFGSRARSSLIDRVTAPEVPAHAEAPGRPSQDGRPGACLTV